jgi:hypothetical protein
MRRSTVLSLPLQLEFPDFLWTNNLAYYDEQKVLYHRWQVFVILHAIGLEPTEFEVRQPSLEACEGKEPAFAAIDV